MQERFDTSLDATQVSAYVWGLGLAREQDCVPHAKPGLHLDPAQATEVQAKCQDRVLDVPRVAVAHALEKIEHDLCVGAIGAGRSGQAAAYIQSHVRPTYHGVGTILDSANGLDTPDRRDHLRTLVRKMGSCACRSRQGAWSHHLYEGQFRGLGSLARVSAAVYVRLCKDDILFNGNGSGKPSRLNLWTCFDEDESKRVGLDFWVEAHGAQPD